MAQFSSVGRTGQAPDPFKGMTKTKKKDAKPSAPHEILLGEHSRYQVKSGWLAGKFVARAFPKPPTKARGMIAEATGATEEAAIAALQDILDAREDRRTGERREDPRTGIAVPGTEEYVEAIRQVALSRPQHAMLAALSLAGEDGLTDGRMASVAGYKSQASANRSFLAAGLLIAEYLSVKADPDQTSGASEGAALLGFKGETETDGGTGNWILHEELREAIRMTL